MEVFETQLQGTCLFKPAIFEDERGFFYEGFNQDRLKEQAGIDFNIVQINQSQSSYGVLRGLHFQTPPFEQAKLVSVVQGEVLDVAVDLRKNSRTYGRWESYILSEVNKHHFFIPRGFAHGFVVLSRTARFMYGIDNFYSYTHDGGIKHDDADLAIDWTIKNQDIILSEKDKKLPLLKELDNPFKL